ncbi:MAG: hypothetical protein VKL39_17410 [Leptolyngbyaceae bacterium]|nr:hypothetical protein [Leptolyngbyaceae bacterium]
MSKVLQKNPAFVRLCHQLPPETLATFNAEQLAALEEAIVQTWRNHPFDVRLTLPLFRKKIYVVIVAGLERRSSTRIRQERNAHPIWKPVNLAVIALIATSAVGLISGVLTISALNQRFSDQADFPTSVPFKTSRQECEESGRTWSDGKCIDYEHDASF